MAKYGKGGKGKPMSKGSIAGHCKPNGSSGNMAGMGGKKSSFAKGGFKGKTP